MEDKNTAFESSGKTEQSSQINLTEIKQIIDDHFNKIKGLVRYTKEKDANVIVLSKQLQVYRDGFEPSLLKRVALEIIEYRESCRKSLRDINAVQLNAKDAQKYVGYLKLDFEDMLENLGIKCSGEAIFYNGKNIADALEKSSFRETPAIEEIDLPDAEITDMCGLIEYLKSCEEALAKMIQNNIILDSVIKDYISVAAVYEQGLCQVVLYPVIRAIVKIYRALSERMETLEITDSNAAEIYSGQLSLLVEEFEKVLELCNVQIDSFVSDSYDSKKHRILKMIDTQDPELNGRVSCRYTDCYMMDDKVIYLSKIDVYKTKKN